MPRAKGLKETASPQLDKRLLELTALFEINRSLNASLSLHAILENILRIPMGHMLLSRGVVLLKKESGGEYAVEELKGLSRNLMGKTLQMGSLPSHSVLVKEIDEAWEWLDFFREFGIELLLPLNSSKGTIGIVGFGEKISGEPFEESEIEFLDSLSNIAATAVKNGLMVEEIQVVNRRLDRKIQQLNTIFDISQELNATLDRSKIGSLLSFAVMGELLVNKCVVLTKEGEKMKVLVAKGISAHTVLPIEPCILSEPLLLEDTDKFEHMKQAGLSVLVPMRIQEETKGLLGIGAKISGGAFNEGDLEFLKTLGNQAMAALENARLFEETLEKQRMEEELNLARSIQQGLLPAKLPQPRGYEIAALNVPSRQVGGDYYDVIPLADGRYGIAIADVSGKGAGAALLMANLQASLHALTTSRMVIPEMISRINDLIHQNTAMDKYITFFYGELDAEKNILTFCNAGHNPPYKMDIDGKTVELITGGIVLGMMPGMKFETEAMVLKQGDRIVLYTDGVTEAMNMNDEEFGEDRIRTVMKNHSDLSADGLLDKVVSEVKTYSSGTPQGDDITLVVIRVL